MEQQESLADVLRVLWKWRKKIILFTAIATIGSIIISLLMPNFYKAETIFFAASTDLNKPEQVFGETRVPIRYYGDDYDNDRLLTVATSAELVDLLLDSFHLAEHYKMKIKTPKQQHKLEKKFRSRYEVTKTKFDAIDLSFEDTDPEMAAKIANEARKKIGAISLALLKQSQKKRMETYEKSISKKLKELKIVEDSLRKIQEHYNVLDVKTQGELLSELTLVTEANLAAAEASLSRFKMMPGRRDTVQILTATVAGLKRKMDALLGDSSESQFSLKNFMAGMSASQKLTASFHRLSAQINEEQERLRRIKSIYESDAPTIILAEKAETPKIKSRPKRSIWILATAFAAFIFSILGVLFFESLKKLNLKHIKGE